MILKPVLRVMVGLIVASPSMARAPVDNPPPVTIVDEPFVSAVLRDNRIGLNPARAIKVLPAAGLREVQAALPRRVFPAQRVVEPAADGRGWPHATAASSAGSPMAS